MKAKWLRVVMLIVGLMIVTFPVTAQEVPVDGESTANIIGWLYVDENDNEFLDSADTVLSETWDVVLYLVSGNNLEFVKKVKNTGWVPEPANDDYFFEGVEAFASYRISAVTDKYICMTENIFVVEGTRSYNTPCTPIRQYLPLVVR